MEDQCVFCKIVEKKIPASLVYEDEYTIAFMDNHPVNEGHTLVIPKKHYATIYTLPERETARLYKAVKKVACAVKKAINPEGITISQQNERGAGQDIFHVHVHVIPRYAGQRMPRFEELKEEKREKLESAAAKIKKHIQTSAKKRRL
ncbi:HIT family protein [Candidatus Bathyarchaeota archaeon]|nr:HIT family protein [Candidatus Bathyarchaeota archaeon]